MLHGLGFIKDAPFSQFLGDTRVDRTPETGQAVARLHTDGCFGLLGLQFAALKLAAND